jgi:hypothetical protein
MVSLQSAQGRWWGGRTGGSVQSYMFGQSPVSVVYECR